MALKYNQALAPSKTCMGQLIKTQMYHLRKTRYKKEWTSKPKAMRKYLSNWKEMSDSILE